MTPTEEEIDQRKAALELFDKPLHFEGLPGGDGFYVSHVSRNGMVMLEGQTGEYHPRAFVTGPKP